jgi:O-methyltransferase involved in polyketide biosynthesis
MPELGAVQQTLYIPLLARARETARKRPLLRDPKAVEMVESIDFDRDRFGGSGGVLVVLRTAIFDHWVRAFLAEHPAGTVVELGTGLNTRFERVDNGQVHWFDLDLPDTIDLRRQFFTDTDRRRMVAASVLDDDWLDTVMASPGPYFFVSEGVLVYLPTDDVLRTLHGIGARFPGARIAIDTYSTTMSRRQHKLGARKDYPQWQWACDDPRTLESLGLRFLESATYSRPPKAIRLPIVYRTYVPLIDRLAGGLMTLALFQSTR